MGKTNEKKDKKDQRDYTGSGTPEKDLSGREDFPP